MLGDAAHSGVEQGLNAALSECDILADCLEMHYDPNAHQESLHKALLAYSQKAVPQGKALDDLSFGPQNVLGKMRWTGKTLRDVVFKGKLGLGEKMSLHNKLTTSLQPFTEIRQGLDRYFGEDFPGEAHWQESLSKVGNDSLQAASRTRMWY
jgi:2-polyprenyl-6-methoxyphenol hydroxylase-like FAD-dependent oxidoreductase